VKQLPSDPSDPLFGRVHIWVMNHNYPLDTVQHATYELAKKRMSSHACECVFFHVNPGLYPNPPNSQHNAYVPCVAYRFCTLNFE
jgi:hypothetical protein